MTADTTPGAQLRQTLVDILYRCGAPMTTTDLRERVAELSGGVHPVVTEHIYPSLRVLQRHGKVRRVHVKPGRNVHWQLTRAGAVTAAVSHRDVDQAQ